jgi:hypothetical protein
VSAPEGFYVTVVNGTRRDVLLGPYDAREDALENVDRASGYVEERFADGGWWAYGTARVAAPEGRTLPVGKLNDIIGLERP